MTNAAKKALKKLLGKEGFSDHPIDREVMSYDAFAQAYWPEVVLRPSSTEEVAAVIELANRHRFAVVPRGAGSGLSGGSLVLKGGAVLDLTRMNRILEIDTGDMIARVEPGVVTGDLQAAAEAVGLFYPPDPASRAFSTIGGNLAECAGGIRAVKYGVTRDFVLGVNAVLGEGTILKAGARTIKGVVGYDLTRLLIGSEGTLGVITEATLKLLPKPQAKATLVGLFDTIHTAARAVGAVFKVGLLPVALEFMDNVILDIVSARLPFALKKNEGALVLAEVDGNAKAVRDEAKQIAAAFKGLGGRVVRAKDDDEAEALWAARRSVSPAIRDFRPFKIAEDVAVPRSKLPRMVDRVAEIGRKTGLVVAAYGHAGDGNCHVNVLFDREEDRPTAEKAVEMVLRAALDLGGTISGEHGVGTAKAPYLAWELSAEEIEFMLRLKRLFDPNSILNPGKIFQTGEATLG